MRRDAATLALLPRLEDARAMMAGPGVPPSEHQALLAEARRVRDAGGAAATEGGDAAAGTGQKTAGGSEGGRRGGRGGGRGGRRGRAAGAAAGDESPRQRGRRRQHEEDNGSSGSDDGGPSDSGGEAAGRALPGNVVVVSLEGPEAWSLWSIMPGAVVVYDADLALVRRLEAFKVRARRSGRERALWRVPWAPADLLPSASLGQPLSRSAPWLRSLAALLRFEARPPPP